MPSYQNVDVFLRSKDAHMPLNNVLVRVLSEDEKTVYTDGCTDEEGRVSFLLWTDTYTLRFYRYQTRFSMPQKICVEENPGETQKLNAFNVYGEVIVPPVANDPHLCRASGFFRDITGAPQRRLEVIFIGEFAPILLDGSGVLSERRAVRTDENGYACVDLIRCAKYSVTVTNYEDQIRTVLVPDAPSASLPAILFAIPDSISFERPSPWNLSVGKEISLCPTVTTNSGLVTHGTDIENLCWTIDHPEIASLQIQRHQLTIKGLKKGTARLMAERRDKSIMTVPFHPYLSGSGQIISVQ